VPLIGLANRHETVHPAAGRIGLVRDGDADATTT
jgi:hypothetical protein